MRRAGLIAVAVFVAGMGIAAATFPWHVHDRITSTYVGSLGAGCAGAAVPSLVCAARIRASSPASASACPESCSLACALFSAVAAAVCVTWSNVEDRFGNLIPAPTSNTSPVR